MQKSISKHRQNCPCPQDRPLCWRRQTGARSVVVAVLREYQGKMHLSADKIFRLAQRKLPNVSLATVYRNLEELRCTGLVSAIDPGDGCSRFELKLPGKKGHHHHLICTRCYSVIDYNDFEDEERHLIQKTQDHLSDKYGYRIADHQIEFIGVCPNCRKAGAYGNT